MKILLFNDNPVVKKLVALSAQKTKDTLDSVWSLDEVEGSEYDLVIIDDALYSDDLFEMLKMGVSPKSTLLMATRSQAVPSGFDYVINKPFLPTDLVDMLVKIEKKVATPEMEIPAVVNDIESYDAAQFEEAPLGAPAEEEELDLESFDLSGLDDEIDLNDEINLDSIHFNDALPQTTVLDHDEVQEVQNLLDDTDGDDWDMMEEEDIIVKPIDDSLALEDDFDDLLLDGGDVNEPSEEEDFLDNFTIDEPIEGIKEEDEEEFSFDDTLIDEKGLEFDIEEKTEDDPFEDELLLEDPIDEKGLLDDDQLDDLESQIEDAVSHLEPEMLNKELELDEMDLENLIIDEDEMENLGSIMDDLDGMDPLDTLDERALKEAIGEDVDELVLDDNDEMNETDSFEQELNAQPAVELEQPASSNVEGIEALQTLLKTLTNEEVTKALKGLNITININFGNGA